MNVPVITLNSGVRIANFSSAHPIEFHTGEVLPACSPERSRVLNLEEKEQTLRSSCGRWEDVVIYKEMSEVVENELRALVKRDDIDIILCPLPVLQAARAKNIRSAKLRGQRMFDRVKKIAYSDRFTIA